MTGALRQPRDTDARRAALRVGTLGLRLYHHGGDRLAPAFPDRHSIADAIDMALRDIADPGDPSYWVIRRLDVRFRAVAGLGAAHLAQAFATQLRTRIRRVLAGEIVEGVRRYDSRADWLAECLWAQAQGHAAQHWQFGRYHDHGGLAAGDAVRLTMQAELPLARAALARLVAAQRIRPFCDRIGEASCRAVLRLILPSGSRNDHVAGTAPLRQFLLDERRLTPHRRYAAALAAIARLSTVQTGGVLPGFATLLNAEAVPVLPPRQSSAVPALSWHAPGRGVPARSTLHVPHAPATAPRGAEHIAPRSDHAAAAPAPGLETGFAGVFVLWRSVVALDLLAVLPSGPAAGPARLALAATLAGPHHRAAWADPALHWLCDHTPEKGATFPAAPRDLARRFADHFIAWRRPFPVVPTLTQVGRSPVLQDGLTEDWLWVGDRRTALRRAGRTGAPLGAPDPAARDPGVDLNWFGVAHRCDRRPWVLLARAAYGDFARRLNGLQGASAAWAWDRLLAGWGLLEAGSPARLTLPHVPLDLVLRMGGLDGAAVPTPGGTVTLHLPGAV